MTTRIFLFLAVIIATLPGCKKDPVLTKQSFYYDTQSSSWTTSDNGITWTASFAVPEITSNVMNSGAVLVYQVYTNGGTTYNEQVPTYYPGSSFNISAVISTGYIDLYYESTNSVAFANPGNLSYRVVIIDGPGKKGYEPAANEVLIKTVTHR